MALNASDQLRRPFVSSHLRRVLHHYTQLAPVPSSTPKACVWPPALRTKSVHDTMLLWCFVSTWIVRLCRHKYSLLRPALTIPGLDSVAGVVHATWLLAAICGYSHDHSCLASACVLAKPSSQLSDSLLQRLRVSLACSSCPHAQPLCLTCLHCLPSLWLCCSHALSTTPRVAFHVY